MYITVLLDQIGRIHSNRLSGVKRIKSKLFLAIRNTLIVTQPAILLASELAAHTVTDWTRSNRHSDLSVGAAVPVSGGNYGPPATDRRPVAVRVDRPYVVHTARRILWTAAHARSKDIVRSAVAAGTLRNKHVRRGGHAGTEESCVEKTPTSLLTVADVGG